MQYTARLYCATYQPDQPCKIRVKPHLQDSGPQWCPSYFSSSAMSLRSLQHLENTEMRTLLSPTLHSCHPEKWHDPRKPHWVRRLFLVFSMLLIKVQRDNPCKEKQKSQWVSDRKLRLRIRLLLSYSKY